MEHSDKHLEIIDYLYGEMTEEEKKAFEAKMDNDSELKKQVGSLRETRELLGKLPKEDEPTPKSIPVTFIPRPQGGQWIKPVLAVAASIVILLVAGYLTQFTIQYDSNGLLIGFAKELPDPSASKPEVEEMIREALVAQRASFDRELTQTRDSLRQFYAFLAQYEQEQTQQKVPSNVVGKSELQQQLAGWQSTNKALLQNYLTAVNQQQQEYLEEALMQFSDYLQEQRENDLLMIKENLIGLKNYQDEQKRETNQVLAGIMKTVSQRK